MRTSRQQIVAALFAVVLVSAAAQQVAAQSIRGKLLDQFTNQPIPNATVTLVTPDNKPVGRSVKSGSDGSFTIQAPAPGIYRLRTELPGYVAAMTPAIDLGQGDVLNLTLKLLAGVVQLRPIAIASNDRPTSPKLKGFYDRAQRKGFG